MRTPTICICKNKAADQLCRNCTAISAFVFAARIVQSLFFLNPKFQASRPASVTVQADLCQTWSEPKLLVFSCVVVTEVFYLAKRDIV